MKVSNLKEKMKPYILVAPVTFILVAIFVSGIIMGLMQSLGYFKIVGLTEFTLKYYKEVLTSRDFLLSLKFSLYTSFVSSFLAIIFGIILSYGILQIKEKKGIAEFLFRIPVVVPHIVSVLLVYNILSQTGIIPRILFQLGLITEGSQFPSILYDKNGIGIIITYLWKEIPFVALTTYTILRNVSNKLSDVASNLGANKRQIFFHILFPLIMPSVFSSFIIIFAFSFGAYEVPLLLGPTQPKALSVQAFIEYGSPILTNRPYAMVYNILITLIALFLTWLYYKAFEKSYKYTR